MADKQFYDFFFFFLCKFRNLDYRRHIYLLLKRSFRRGVWAEEFVGFTSTSVLTFPVSPQEPSASLNVKVNKRSVLTLNTFLREEKEKD